MEPWNEKYCKYAKEYSNPDKLDTYVWKATSWSLKAMGIAAIKWKPNFGNESFASIAISKKYCSVPHFIYLLQVLMHLHSIV